MVPRPGTGPPKARHEPKLRLVQVLENSFLNCHIRLCTGNNRLHTGKDAWETKGGVLGGRGAAAAGGQLRGRGGARGRYGRSTAWDPLLAVEQGPGPTPVAGEWSPDAVRPPALHVHVRAARAHAALACAYCCGWRSDRMRALVAQGVAVLRRPAGSRSCGRFSVYVPVSPSRHSSAAFAPTCARGNMLTGACDAPMQVHSSVRCHYLHVQQGGVHNPRPRIASG
jgi:hypothetical protein